MWYRLPILDRTETARQSKVNAAGPDARTGRGRTRCGGGITGCYADLQIVALGSTTE
jgi:hypothetical protein